jgi:predicted nucleotidyltransferase
MHPELPQIASCELSRTLDLFLKTILGLFKQRLVSVVLYGSIVFDDLAPGYGDLDFLAVVDGDITDSMARKLVEVRRPFRDRTYGVLAEMIEGAFLPRRMLDPANTAKAFWWGTHGEREWERNELGWFVLHTIRERGVVIYGEDIRPEIPTPSREALLEGVSEFCEGARKHGEGGNLHSVDWLLAAARMLLWLREGRLSSKSEAADWGYHHATGEWRKHLPRARATRLNPASGRSPESKSWLDSLDRPIKEAVEEVEHELLLKQRKLESEKAS